MGRTAYTRFAGLPSARSSSTASAGMWVSDWYPEIATCVDDIAVIRSCTADGLNHVGSVCQMNTGSVLGGRPCLGSWALYGLGTREREPARLRRAARQPDEPPGGSRNWGTGFMPADYQGTQFRDGATPILHLAPPDGVSPAAAAAQARLRPASSTALHRDERGRRRPARSPHRRLRAGVPHARPRRKRSTSRTRPTRRSELYGLDDKETAHTGRNCLLARRLVERGVRFVQLYFGSGSKWDAHADIEGNHAQLLPRDRPADRRPAEGPEAARACSTARW